CVHVKHCYKSVSIYPELFPVMLSRDTQLVPFTAVPDESGSHADICHSTKHWTRWENQLPPQPKLRRWITAKDGTHYEMYGNFRTPDLDDIRCQVGRHTLVFCGFSHEPGTGLPGVFAERGKRTGGNSHPVLHWLLLGHVEQF